MKAIIPISVDQLGGPSITADADYFEVLAERDKVVLVEFIALPDQIVWLNTYELMCQRQHDPDTIKVVRKATAEERRQFRVPLWIQGEELPVCCGRQMFFVGQMAKRPISLFLGFYLLVAILTKGGL